MTMAMHHNDSLNQTTMSGVRCQTWLSDLEKPALAVEQGGAESVVQTVRGVGWRLTR